MIILQYKSLNIAVEIPRNYNIHYSCEVRCESACVQILTAGHSTIIVVLVTINQLYNLVNQIYSITINPHSWTLIIADRIIVAHS